MLKTILLVLLIVLALVGLYFVVAVILEIRRRRRINRIFVDKVVDQIMEHWDAASEPLSVREESPEQAIDERFEDAARLVVSTQSSLRSDLQRKLALGYARAGRILDQLEEAGIVGPMNGTQPREVLVKDSDELEQVLSRYRSMNS